MGNTFSPTDGWGSAVTMAEADFPYIRDPTVACNADGDFITAWTQFEDMDWFINVRHYSSSEGWGDFLPMNTGENNDLEPSITINTQGNAVLVWVEDSGGIDNIWSAYFVVGTGWSQPILVETVNSDVFRSPEVALNDAGTAFVVWETWIFMGDLDIWGNRFVFPDTTAPMVSITSPEDGNITEQSTIMIIGTTEPGSHLVVNGIIVDVAQDGSFEVQISLTDGNNTITATATDEAGNSASDSITVNYSNPLLGMLEQTQLELDNTKDELEAVNQSLEDTQGELETVSYNLEDAQEELDTAQEDLEATETELDQTKSDIGTLWLVLIGGLVGVIALILVIQIVLGRTKKPPIEQKEPDA